MQNHDELRRDRLKAALRHNLKRRKAQARARSAEEPSPAAAEAPPAEPGSASVADRTG